jgi:hypothetical protein
MAEKFNAENPCECGATGGPDSHANWCKNGKVPKKSRPQPKGGSRKGIPNKATKELKELILGALDAAGGVEYLTERANDPRTASAFLTLVGKVLPLTVAGTGKDGAIIIQASSLDERL